MRTFIFNTYTFVNASRIIWQNSSLGEKQWYRFKKTILKLSWVALECHKTEWITISYVTLTKN